MKCPLSFMTRPGLMRKDAHPNNECLKEECAWWDAPAEQCLMLNISEKASFIYLELNDIRGKLPRY